MIQKPYNVLLVEDDESHAELVIRNLKRHQIVNKIFLVNDGEEALKFLFEQKKTIAQANHPLPDVILLDLRLPRIDGLEVLKRIKEEPELACIPVIILSTSQAQGDVKLAYQYGANSYLVKPIDYTDFNKLLTDFGYYWFKWNQKVIKEK